MANNLVVQLLLKTGTFSTDLKTARGQIQNFQKGCQTASKSFTAFGQAIGVNVGQLTKFGSVIGIAAVAVVLLHLYVGLGAIRASSGSKKRGYLRVTVVLLIFGVINLLGYGGQAGDLSNFSFDDTTIAAFMVDVTVIIMLIGILRSAKMIKKLTMEKEQGIQGA